MSDLKPCPFCGGEARVVLRDVEPQGDPYYGEKMERFVQCQSCAAVVFNKYWHDGFYSKDDAVSAWNTRALEAEKASTAKTLIELQATNYEQMQTIIKLRAVRDAAEAHLLSSKWDENYYHLRATLTNALAAAKEPA